MKTTINSRYVAAVYLFSSAQPFLRVDMNADPAFVKASARVRRVA